MNRAAVHLPAGTCIPGSARVDGDVVPPTFGAEDFEVRRARVRDQAPALARFRHSGIDTGAWPLPEGA